MSDNGEGVGKVTVNFMDPAQVAGALQARASETMDWLDDEEYEITPRDIAKNQLVILMTLGAQAHSQAQRRTGVVVPNFAGGRIKL